MSFILYENTGDIRKSDVDTGYRGHCSVCTVLTAACLGGHSDIVVELLQCGANVALPNTSGLYPLLCASSTGQWQTVDALLAVRQATSQLSYVDSKGRTALIIAAAAGHLSIIELLLSKGCRFCWVKLTNSICFIQHWLLSVQWHALHVTEYKITCGMFPYVCVCTRVLGPNISKMVKVRGLGPHSRNFLGKS